MSEKKNPFDTGVENPGYDGDETSETGENIEMDRFLNRASSRRGSEDPGSSHQRTNAETSFGGDTSVIKPQIQR